MSENEVSVSVKCGKTVLTLKNVYACPDRQR